MNQNEKTTCPECGGSGHTMDWALFAVLSVPIESTCPRCGGTGEV